MYGGTNITGVRLFDPDDPEISQMLKVWTDGELSSNENLLNITPDMLEVWFLLLYIYTFPVFSRSFTIYFQSFKTRVCDNMNKLCVTKNNKVKILCIISYMNMISHLYYKQFPYLILILIWWSWPLYWYWSNGTDHSLNWFIVLILKFYLFYFI